MEGEDSLPSIPLLPPSFLGLKGFLQQKFLGEEKGTVPTQPLYQPSGCCVVLSRLCWKRTKEDGGWGHTPVSGEPGALLTASALCLEWCGQSG